MYFSLVKRVTRRDFHVYVKQSEKSIFAVEKVENFAEFIFQDLEKCLHKIHSSSLSTH